MTDRFQAFRFQKRSLDGPSDVISPQPIAASARAKHGLKNDLDIGSAARTELDSALKSERPSSPLTSPGPGEKGRNSARKKRKSDTTLIEEHFEEGLAGLPERLGDQPLRLIIIGTNPSGHAWRSGHYYSNPNNYMWRLLRTAEIAPSHIRGPQDDILMPKDAGVGFLDVGCGSPGTHLSKFSSRTMQSWAIAFYERLQAHKERAGSSIRCECGFCGEPEIVAFAGKRQWMELLNIGRTGSSKLKRVDGGIQSERPRAWPFSLKTQVWVLPSSSGAAAMSTKERYEPYKALGQQLKSMPWPLAKAKSCSQSNG